MHPTLKNCSVLVLDGNQRSALCTTRALGARGIRVIVGEANSHSLAGASKYCKTEIVYPCPLSSSAEMLDTICSVIKSHRIDAVMPMSDISTNAVLLNRIALGNVGMAVPSLHSYDLASDKIRSSMLASEVGIAVPRSIQIAAGESPDLTDPIFDGPVVMKPFRSRVYDGQTFTTTAVKSAASRKQVESLRKDYSWFRDYPYLIQEFIEGHGEGLFTSYRNGEAIAWFAHCRLREKPPSGGCSVLSESRAVPDDLRSLANRLLTRLDWHGPAMLEFRMASDGTPYFMEINARYWGSLQLSVYAGTNFPLLGLQTALGIRPDPVEPYSVGLRNRWLLGDLDHLYLVLKSRKTSFPKKLKSVLTFLNFFDTNTRLEVLRLGDIRPFLRELWSYLRFR